MKICCLGDSLTEGDYGILGKRGIENVHSENYPYFLAKLTGSTVKNYGKCGYNATKYLEYYNSGNVNVKDADIIIIMLGTNGGMVFDNDTQGNADYISIINNCRKDAPNAKIVLCTPPHVTKNPEMSNCGFEDIVNSAAKFVRQVAEIEKLLLIDVAKCDKITEKTEKELQPNDGLHFGIKGYETLAYYIFESLKCFFPICDKNKLIKEFNDLGIIDMPIVTDLNELKGDFVNLEYHFPSGQSVKLWDDNKMYYGNQLYKKNSSRCYGLVADENYILVCEYGDGGETAEIVLLKKL